GLNWHELARWNNIGPPYTIHVGQRLSLDPFPPLDYGQMRRQRRAARNERHPTPRSTVTAMPSNRGPSVTRLPSQRQAPQQPASRQQTPQQQQTGRSSPAPIAPVQPPVRKGSAAKPTTPDDQRTVASQSP